uniref:ABC transporter family G domain-containing protein n=1 Tax=Zea mays TaxID=4577 RepID=A0A804LC09_MAIZE
MFSHLTRSMNTNNKKMSCPTMDPEARNTLIFSLQIISVARVNLTMHFTNKHTYDEVNRSVGASTEASSEANTRRWCVQILGLDMCADIIVGNELMRDISGGQKKRLTTGEMLVGLTKVLFMDEISTGLDSSTTFQIVKCIQQIVHLGEATVLASLLQPAPEVFDLFDDVMLLSEGQIVYQGPREYVLEFFERVLNKDIVLPTLFLERGVVVGVEAVDADDAVAALAERQRAVRAHEARGARYYKFPLQRYMALVDLQEGNERLFYKLLIDNIEEPLGKDP